MYTTGKHLGVLFLSIRLIFAQSVFDDWEHGRVQLDQANIHFRYAGSGPPILLIHGNPQHSITWRLVGPLLTSNYTVIAPDNRGSGDSSLAADGQYNTAARLADIQGLLSYLGINRTYVVAHDWGSSTAIALSGANPELVAAVAVAEMALPGSGLEQVRTPQGTWNLNANWHLALFSINDAAEFLIQGREREFLSWYLWHASYKGLEVFPESIINRLTTSVRKPGFLHGMVAPFGASNVANDADLFANMFRPERGGSPMPVPLLAVGGESSIGSNDVLQQVWSGVSVRLTTDIAPKAGHWIPDENPQWLVDRVLRHFWEQQTSVPPVDLSWLD